MWRSGRIGAGLATLGCTLLLSCSTNAPSSSDEMLPRASAAESDYEGYLEIVDGRGISGWVWNKHNPDAPLDVDIYDGATVLTKLAASKPRKDLVEHHKGNGQHGFECKLPASLKDGKDHIVHVKIAGADFELARSPKTLRAESAQ